jgi:hypothetical protein
MTKTKNVLILALFVLIIAGCNLNSHIANSRVLIGHWVCVGNNNAIAPDLYITTRQNPYSKKENVFFIIFNGEEGNDSLSFGYRLKGSKNLFLYTGKHLMSKNKILFLGMDSLEYKRAGDKEIFSYKKVD